MEETKELYFVTYYRPSAIVDRRSNPERQKHCRARLGYLTDEVKIRFEEESVILNCPDEFKLQSEKNLGLLQKTKPADKAKKEALSKRIDVHKKLISQYELDSKNTPPPPYIVKINSYKDLIGGIAKRIEERQARIEGLLQPADDGSIHASDSPANVEEQSRAPKPPILKQPTTSTERKKLEPLREIAEKIPLPVREREDDNWILAKNIGTPAVGTLKNARSDARRAQSRDDGEVIRLKDASLLGRDKQGRIWWQFDEGSQRVLYFRSSLAVSASQTPKMKKKKNI